MWREERAETRAGSLQQKSQRSSLFPQGQSDEWKTSAFGGFDIDCYVFSLFRRILEPDKLERVLVQRLGASWCTCSAHLKAVVGRFS